MVYKGPPQSFGQLPQHVGGACGVEVSSNEWVLELSLNLFTALSQLVGGAVRRTEGALGAMSHTPWQK
jgi:hypothetical protein